MWLIDNNTLRLRSVDDETVERYAILSHAWEVGQEVTFQDMDPAAQARVIHRRGFEKIRARCRQALADGLQYSWVDTCCIDKTSDTKLSEAINSMYRWYEAAEVCYVFLADLVLDQGEERSSFTKGCLGVVGSRAAGRSVSYPFGLVQNPPFLAVLTEFGALRTKET